ncbi:MAG: TRAP transporter permease DctQ [Deltaproteobacteria bacterium]|nr:MAG: TRAP transporter permease DctQ [Deltaproteobacteria bacterium]
MALFAFANVVTRYIFQYPLAFTEELEVNALVWLTMLGTASAFKRRRHLSMLFFQQKFPSRIQALIQFAVVCMSIGVFVWLGYLGYLQMVDEMELEITSESLDISQHYYTAGIPLGCALVVVRILQSSFADLRGSVKGKALDGEG